MSLSQEKRAAHIAAGLCTRCDGGPCRTNKPQRAEPGQRSCADCARSHLRSENKTRGKFMRQKRCACGAPRRLSLRTYKACAEVAVLKDRVVRADCVRRGVCATCREKPAREREPRARPPRKQRAGHPAGMNSAAYDKPRMLECLECSEHRKSLREDREEKKANAAEAEQAARDDKRVVVAARRNFRHASRAA